MNTPAPKPNRPSPPGSKTPWNPTCPSHTPATGDNATGEPFPDTTATAPGTQGICYIAWRITTSTNMPYTDLATQYDAEDFRRDHTGPAPRATSKSTPTSAIRGSTPCPIDDGVAHRPATLKGRPLPSW